MLRSTAIVIAVAGLVGTGVAAAVLHQSGPQQRNQDGPSITRSTLIVIDKDGAQACSNWAGSASSCARLESEAPSASPQN